MRGTTTIPLLAGLACAACPPASRLAGPPAAPEPVTVLFTGDLHGVTEPCGCTADVMLGGIDRLATAVAEGRRDAPAGAIVVDSGDLLAATAEVPPEREAQERLRADLIADSFAAIGVQAVAVGERDLAFGLEGMRRAGSRGSFTWLAANLEAKGAPWQGHLLIEVGSTRAAVIGLTDPALLPEGLGIAGRPPGEILAPLVKSLRAEGAGYVVVLGHMGRRQAKRIMAETPGIDLWVRGHAPQPDATGASVGDGWMVEPHEEAQSLGRVVAIPATDGGRIVPVHASAEELPKIERKIERLRRGIEVAEAADRDWMQAEIEGLEARAALARRGSVARPAAPGELAFQMLKVVPETPQDEKVRAMREAFNAKLKDVNLASARPPPPLPPGAPGYASVEECGMCHEDQATQWAGTPHARAMPTLEARGKDFDEECVSCHVTGYRRPGGSAIGFLGNLTNVQCEACHGPGLPHADDGTAETAPSPAVGPEVCGGCHNAKHSPKFDYKVWRKRILGPGHGVPASAQQPPSAP